MGMNFLSRTFAKGFSRGVAIGDLIPKPVGKEMLTTRPRVPETQPPIHAFTITVSVSVPWSPYGVGRELGEQGAEVEEDIKKAIQTAIPTRWTAKCSVRR
jgi:hypothetical protein